MSKKTPNFQDYVINYDRQWKHFQQPETRSLLLGMGICTTTVLGFATGIISLPRKSADKVLIISGALAGAFTLLRVVAMGATNHHEKRLDGKVVIVTDANTGIGLPTAVKLASLGAHVVIACRESAKTQRALEEIRKRSKSTTVTHIPIDLSSFQSVRTFVDTFRSRFDRLDVLVNNAGVVASGYQLSADGYEMNIATNHLGHALLTILLMDYLMKPKTTAANSSAAAGSNSSSGAGACSSSSSASTNTSRACTGRVINVSSNGHWIVPNEGISADEILNVTQEKFDTLISYGNSKLANVLFTTELQRRYGPLGVNSYSLHPGAVQTELARGLPPVTAFITHTLACIFFKSPEQGAQTTLYCALSNQAVPGMFHRDCNVDPTTADAMSAKLAKQLWEKTMKILGI